MNVRDDAHARPMDALLNHVNARREERFVAAKLVDRKTANAFPLRMVQQRHRPQQRREHAASIDVAHQQAGRIRSSRHPHVHDVARLQVDFRRRARAFHHDDVVHGRERVIAVDDQRKQFFDAPLVIVARRDLSPDLPLHDDLRARIRRRLDQHRVHLYGRRHPARLGLQRLRAADFTAVHGGGGIERHVLRLERRHAVAAIRENAAQRRHDQRLPDVRRGAEHHERPRSHQRVCPAPASDNCANACARDLSAPPYRSKCRAEASGTRLSQPRVSSSGSGSNADT